MVHKSSSFIFNYTTINDEELKKMGNYRKYIEGAETP